MAQMPLRPCRHSGCSALTRTGWCPKHKPKHIRKESAAYHGWYLLPIWKNDLRPNQLLHEPYCRECARKGFRVAAEVVDHITPHQGVWRLFVDRNNLQSLCKHCHDLKTSQERQERANSGRKIHD